MDRDIVLLTIFEIILIILIILGFYKEIAMGIRFLFCNSIAILIIEDF